jgi:hypothetical protein
LNLVNRIPLPAIDQTENQSNRANKPQSQQQQAQNIGQATSQHKYQQDKGSKVLRWYQISNNLVQRWHYQQNPELKQPCIITQATQDKKLCIIKIRADAIISESQHRSSKNHPTSKHNSNPTDKQISYQHY